MARILVVEDDRRIAEMVQLALTKQNHVVDVASDGEQGLAYLKHYQYDVAIVDWVLPQLSGYDMCKKYREEGGKCLILFLTAKSELQSRVGALDAGADDFLAKPFEYDELLAHVRALLRRTQNLQSQTVTAGYLQMDLVARSVTANGAAIELSAAEYQLLELLMKHPGQTYTYTELMDRVFSSEVDGSEHAVRQRVLRLRKKIDIDGAPSLIHTVKGLGYKFNA